MHRELKTLAEQLERTGWAAELCDARWRLVWVSSQLRQLLKAADDTELGLGLPVLQSRACPAWCRVTTPDERRQWVATNLAALISDQPARREQLLAEAHRLFGIQEVDNIPGPALGVWTDEVDSLESEIPLGRIRYFGARIRDPSGRALGTIFIYGSTLPAALLALVARGDRKQFERTAQLVEPASHQAAILFADLQDSGGLSRHLSSRVYFQLISELWSAGDRIVIERGGIVGKHAGDGFTAFFVVEELGTPSRAAASAIGAAHELVDLAASASQRLGGDGPPVRLNIGLHWGPSLYMGQVITGGRLEVTALGDEVNEAARIQHAARDGTILASKSLVEHLEPQDASPLGLDPPSLRYSLLAELPDVDAKDVRDAGRIPLAALTTAPSGAIAEPGAGRQSAAARVASRRARSR